MNDHLHAADASFFNANHLKGIVLIIYLLVYAGEVAFQFQQQTSQSVSISLNVGEFLIINLQNLSKIAEQRLSFKDKGILVQFGIVTLLLIVLIVDFTYYFFKDILQRHQAAGTTKLVNNDSNVHLILLKFA